MRGRSDSDGSVVNHQVRLYGAEDRRSLLELDKALCEKLGIYTGEVMPYGKLGNVTIRGGCTGAKYEGCSFR